MSFKIAVVIFMTLASILSFGQEGCKCPIAISKDIDEIQNNQDSLKVFQIINKYRASKYKSCIYEASVLELQFYYLNKRKEKISLLLNEQERMLSLMDCDDEYYIDFYLNKTCYYKVKGDFEKLSEFAFKALKEAERLGDENKEVEAIKEIVFLFTRLNEDEKIWDYVKRAEKLINKKENSIQSVNDYRWLGYQYETKYTKTEHKTLIDSSLIFINRAKTGALKHKINYELALVYRAFEACSYHKGNLNDALKYIDSAIYYGKKIKGVKNLGGLYLSKAWDHLDLGQLEEASKWMDTSLFHDNKNDIAGYMMLQYEASQIYQGAGKYDKALDSYKVYSKMKDSIINLERLEVINELETKYKTEAKDAQIKRLIILLIVSALIIICILFIGKLVQLKRIRKKNEALKMAFEKQLQLEKELTDVRDDIAQDFHDDLGNKLARISLLSNLVNGEVAINSPNIKSKIKQISEDANGLYNGTRDFVFSLKSNSDYLEEIVTYLSDFGQDYFSKTSIKFRIQKDVDTNIKLPHYWNRQLIYIFKEAMTNALKHAKCNTVDLRVSLKNDIIQMECRDDGIGLSEEDLKSSNGIFNMKCRAKKIGGELNVLPVKGKGTAVSFTGNTVL